MKFEFSDASTGEQLIVIKTPNVEFGMEVFNLFMLEMLRLHGITFQKMSSDVGSDDTGAYIHMIYTHNIVGRLHPNV